MIIAEVEYFRGINWQHMNDLGFFHCDFKEDGCKCADMHPDHVEMHKIAMHEFIKGIQPGTDPMACPTCTPTFKLTKLFPPEGVSHRWDGVHHSEGCWSGFTPTR